MALIDNLVSSNVINPLKKIGSSAIDSVSGLSRSRSSSSSGGTGASRDQYEFSKYNIEALSYPLDLLGNNKDLSTTNYAIFYINVSVDSRVLSTKKEEVVEGVTRDLRGDFIGQKITEAQAKVSAAGIGAVKGGIVGAIVDGKSPTGAILGAVGGELAVGILSPSKGDKTAGSKTAPTFTRPQKRLKKAIALYMPNALETSYSVGYGEVDTNIFQMGALATREVADAVASGFSKNNLQSLQGIAKDIATSVAVSKGNAALGIGAGRAVNPKKEQEFKGVNFRSFTFKYTFAPRDKAEADAVRAIIYEFKYHMHPEFLNETAFTYVYPSEFDIVYYSGSRENENLHKHASCVLESVNVDYTPNALFSTFSDGMPSQINLTLSFRELLAHTKETIERGL